jgi:hypothetical protein
MIDRRTLIAAAAAPLFPQRVHPEIFMTNDNEIIELRDYTLRPGLRDDLISLFEDNFIESQENAGMRIIATFRDLDRPDHFVWLRGFPSMAARGAALGAFYSGPVWATHRALANETMLDSDNVFMMRPLIPMKSSATRPPVGSSSIPDSVFRVEIYFPGAGREEDFAAYYASQIDPLWRAADGFPLARFVSDARANNFPQLPIRSDRVFVSLIGFADEAAHERSVEAVNSAMRSHAWRKWNDNFVRPPATLKLQPTARALLRSPTTLNAAAAGYVGDAGDFNFLAGNWNVANRRLKRRHVGADDWDVFPATNRLWKLLDGVANVDEFDCPARGFKGASVRTLDLSSRQWAIYWINSTRGMLEPPVFGGFRNGDGLFYGKDADDGAPVDVRFRWRADNFRPHWEQAFSKDGGASWEINWVMEFSRL